MANPNYQSGGVFVPNSPARITSSDPWNFDTAPTVGTDVGQGAQTLTTNSSTQTLTNKTLTAPTLTAPVISGAATLASGATLTTPTVAMTVANVTATGTGATDATVLPSVYPAFITVTTGATGSGVALPAAAAVTGAMYFISNQVAATLRIYSSGATINGTTGTTAFTVTNTGNKFVTIGCSVAGAWTASGNT